MNLDELDEKICKMRAMNDRREIELNKLEAYYWLKTNFNIEAENIDKINYSIAKDVSKVFMKNRGNDENCHIVKGHVHNILMGLDTSYKKTPIWAELEK